MGDAVAAIDCGTNTVKLLVGSFAGDGLDVVERRSEVVRLGQGVDATGRLGEEALARTFAALDDYAGLVRAHGVPPERIRFCATSATRDAANAAEFASGVHARLGVSPEVLSGDEEAALAFAGAMRGVGHATAPLLVLDVGGGSTEVILGDRDGVRVARSMDVGSVRLHERHVRHDPPTAAEVAAVAADVDAHLDGCGVPLAEAATVVGIAGTCTSLAAGVLDLPAYDPAAIDGSAHAVAEVRETIDRVVALTVDERRALPWLHPGRADVIGAGLVIVERVLARTTVAELVVSESDILEGIAWSLAP
ncbi:exopolyphosphatase [Nocardioides coralli]|uniref:Ppx/GppA phosphatase family protein n=1 Tax=Nocardioides coralli TaxID=2872154 RepID=UPI001CA39064|nr:exopolyphosphatase [Nocardioides coralli]QZY29822.1 exopolyphosphatase [Nocardioides coralli]